MEQFFRRSEEQIGQLAKGLHQIFEQLGINFILE